MLPMIVDRQDSRLMLLSNSAETIGNRGGKGEKRTNEQILKS